MVAGFEVLAADTETTYRAEHYVRRTIYHSPETPGYTCWLGALELPDKSLAITFTQDTGPTNRTARGSDAIRKQFYPHLEKPARDATGLNKSNLFLHSTDEGKTWQETGSFGWEGPFMYIAPGGQDAVLKDGSWLKGVFGYFQSDNPDVAHSAYLIRSRDLGKTWSKPQVLGDPARETWRLTRIRRLRDGRLIATGGRSRVPSTSDITTVWDHWEPLLIVSQDDGKTWSAPIEIINAKQRKTWRAEEYDTAEMPNGDLICVFRRFDPDQPNKQVRWQGLLKKIGGSWKTAYVEPSSLPHSGHPELLMTREGVVLHIATTGVDWTRDGRTWTPVKFPGLKDGYHSRYYPKSLQVEDGTIYVFGHAGWDNDYGAVDEAVVMDTFRISAE
jgi:BNR repeat-like domain